VAVPHIYYNPIIEYFTENLGISNLQRVGKLMGDLFIEFYRRIQILSIKYFGSSGISSYIFELAKELAENDQYHEEYLSSLQLKEVHLWATTMPPIFRNPRFPRFDLKNESPEDLH
jgi:hypothetical protein